MSPEIMTRTEPVKIGFPVNSRIAADCAPIKDLLGFGPERSDGTVESPRVPNATFVPLRVRTIAQYLKNKILQLGVLGDDTALDVDLDCAPGSTDGERIRVIPSGEDIFPAWKLFTFNRLPAAGFCLLRRQDEPIEVINDFIDGKRPGRIVTSYPRLTRKAMFPAEQYAGTVIEKNEGQNERLLRAMPDRFIAAADIVRTGETARKYGLEFSPLIETRPGLWRAIYWDGRDTQILDTAEQIRERLGPII